MLKPLLKKLLIKICNYCNSQKANQNKIINPEGTIILGDISLLQIGNQVSFGGNVRLHIDAPIYIGENTMIAPNVVIHTNTHNYSEHPMWTHRVDKPIHIGKNVWIGIGALILAGVIIEDFAVVAAGSVVTANVPEGAIVAGNPAKIIKRRDKSIYLGKPIINYHSEVKIQKGTYKKNYCKDA